MFNFFKRDVLIGIGAGFIISGIMVSVFGIGQPTDEQIKEKAAKLGMVETIDSLKGQSQPSQPEQQPAPSAQTNPAVNEQSKPAATKRSDNSLTENNSNEQDREQKTEPKTEKVKSMQTVSFEIKSGMGSETISRLLEEKGIIKDQNAFYKLVTTRKAHSSFRTGIFRLPVSGDMEEVLRILTGRE